MGTASACLTNPPSLPAVVVFTHGHGFFRLRARKKPVETRVWKTTRSASRMRRKTLRAPMAWPKLLCELWLQRAGRLGEVQVGRGDGQFLSFDPPLYVMLQDIAKYK